ncbi:MAG: family 10 glycosylhydrolase [Clostridiales bacterium]|nr:family 10 glycosylhydrolase [Clostridiales bacterium]
MAARKIALILAFSILFCLTAYAQTDQSDEFRGVWIATVGNINWPDADSGAEKQKADFVRLMDEAAAMNLNAVVVQIRPAADAFYKSEYNPWSEYLTGTQGKDPGYDPLQFMLDEAHKRGLEFHAWFNPFRVSTTRTNKEWAQNSVMKAHPDWIRTYGSQIWLDPGLPGVKKYVLDSIVEVVQNYDIDAVHFDDYFYPYPQNNRLFNDDWAFENYGEKYLDRAEWRRHNIDDFIQSVSEVIKSTKSYVKFGVSPNGIWRNSSVDPEGSDTNGLAAYDILYADTRKWVLEGWVDYVAPQIYWTVGYKPAAYEKLLAFWSNVASQNKSVHLYIGQAAYQVGTSGSWRDASELTRQLEMGRENEFVKGHIYYNIDSLLKNPLSLRDRLINGYYSSIAQIPDMPWLNDRPGFAADSDAQKLAVSSSE